MNLSSYLKYIFWGTISLVCFSGNLLAQSNEGNAVFALASFTTIGDMNVTDMETVKEMVDDVKNFINEDIKRKCGNFKIVPGNWSLMGVEDLKPNDPITPELFAKIGGNLLIFITVRKKESFNGDEVTLKISAGYYENQSPRARDFVEKTSKYDGKLTPLANRDLREAFVRGAVNQVFNDQNLQTLLPFYPNGCNSAPNPITEFFKNPATQITAGGLLAVTGVGFIIDSRSDYAVYRDNRNLNSTAFAEQDRDEYLATANRKLATGLILGGVGLGAAALAYFLRGKYPDKIEDKISIGQLHSGPVAPFNSPSIGLGFNIKLNKHNK